MVKDAITKAVIYTRVSSIKQTVIGTGLKSQEAICREYAKRRELDVTAVFEDDQSGKFAKRPGMTKMLAFLRKHRRDPHIVIIDDISRLARGLRAHLELREAIMRAGGILESPTMQFEDSDEIGLEEGIKAVFAQDQRIKNAAQVLARRRGRLLNGYWPFRAPLGYKFVMAKGKGRVLIREEPLASIIAEGLEGYASDRFRTQEDLQAFLQAQPQYPYKNHPTRVTHLLTRVIYAGYVSCPDWNIGLTEGQHDPLISFTTWKKIQDKRNGVAPTWGRKNLQADFPLRGSVLCECGASLTAGWTKGKTAYHPYYLCCRKGCGHYGKSIRRNVIEGQFEELVCRMRPTPGLFVIACDMFREHWDHIGETKRAHQQSLKIELAKIEQQIEQLLERVTETKVQAVALRYETRIQQLDEEQVLVKERIANCGRPLRRFDEALELSLRLLGNPQKWWFSERLEDKRALLKLAFLDRLVYVRNEGFRTPETTLPFKALAGITMGKNKMVEREGLEPSTSAL